MHIRREYRFEVGESELNVTNSVKGPNLDAVRYDSDDKISACLSVVIRPSARNLEQIRYAVRILEEALVKQGEEVEA